MCSSDLRLKISQLDIENFRQYYDKNSIEFSEDEKTPFTIIRGTNGAGKTNIMNAITWCFYGKEKNLSKAVLGHLKGVGRFRHLREFRVNDVSSYKKGDKIEVELPALGETRTATINLIGNAINPANRTFKIEASLRNSDKVLKPNLLANVKLNDYTKADEIGRAHV